MIDRHKFPQEAADLRDVRARMSDAKHAVQRLQDSRVFRDPRAANAAQLIEAFERKLADLEQDAGHMLNAISASKVLE